MTDLPEHLDLDAFDLPHSPESAETGSGDLHRAWREKVAGEMGLDPDEVESRLAWELADGVEVPALSTEDDRPTGSDPAGLPGVAPFTRGTQLPPSGDATWTLGHRVDDPRPAEANEALLDDLVLGAGLLWLQVDAAGRAGLDADDPRALGRVGLHGVRWSTPVEITALLRDVDPTAIEIFVDAGADALAAAGLYFDWARRRGVEPGKLRGGFLADPLAALARDGSLPGSLDDAFAQAAALASHCRRHAPGLRALGLSTRPFHDAGASPAQELGFGLAAAVESMRRLGEHGLDPGAVAAQTVFVHAVGSRTFVEIAKLRAARLLWSKVLGAAGAASGAALQKHVVFGSDATVTVVDPWTNLLRGTAQIFAAVVGGADAVVPGAYDRRLGTPSDAARRLGLTGQHVLGEESHLRRVADPAGGSWALEELTDRLARRAWDVFRRIEGDGGFVACLRSGDLARRLGESVARRRADLRKRKDGIVGLSVFPDLGEERPERERPDLDAVNEHALAALGSVERPPPDDVAETEELPLDADAVTEAASRNASLGRLAAALHRDEPETAEPLEPFRPSAAWERLRLATDAVVSEGGDRPKIFLANLGSVREHRARTEFAAGLFQAGGIAPLDHGSCEHAPCVASDFRTSGARVAVLCSSDERYAELAADAAAALKEAGASRVYLAGRPGEHEEAWREAGVDKFVYLGCDALAVVEDLLVHLEVLR